MFVNKKKSAKHMHHNVPSLLKMLWVCMFGANNYSFCGTVYITANVSGNVKFDIIFMAGTYNPHDTVQYLPYILKSIM